MGKLCVYIPPFASDYSGVCSALFDFNCLAVINDASCCTGHYVHFDEPRWASKPRPTLSTQLRSEDAILGNDSRVAECVVRAADRVDTDLVALVGTPVPAITGMDMEGIAYEITAQCGRPALGFCTTGFDYYDRGIYLAGRSLINHFASVRLPKKNRGVNILGMTPLDYGNVGNSIALKKALTDAGWEVNVSLFMDSALQDLPRLSAACINLAVSASGVCIARLLQDKFNTPYIAACPMGRTHFSYVCDLLDRKQPLSEWPVSFPNRVLIISDQVIGNSLRDALAFAKCGCSITVASFFTMNEECSVQGDFHIESERKLIEHLRVNRYAGVICDPQIACIPEIRENRHFDIAHPAVSGKLHWDETPQFLSPQFDAWLQYVAQAIN